MADISLLHVAYYVNPQERKPQAQRDWLDLLQGRAHNVHEVDVCALSLLYRQCHGNRTRCHTIYGRFDL